MHIHGLAKGKLFYVYIMRNCDFEITMYTYQTNTNEKCVMRGNNREESHLLPFNKPPFSCAHCCPDFLSQFATKCRSRAISAPE